MRKYGIALLVLVLCGAVAFVVFRALSKSSPTGTMTGKVLSPTGAPVSGAIVRVMRIQQNFHRRRGGFGRPDFKNVQPGQTVWTKSGTGMSKTAANGTFTINNAPVGQYRIMVFDRAVGFGRTQEPVSVAARATVDVGTITLQKMRWAGGAHSRGPPPSQ
ncbi:MAG: carboxypeptidase-like regulatory domain-containing protein [Phycisphaerae bacterium]